MAKRPRPSVPPASPESIPLPLPSAEWQRFFLAARTSACRGRPTLGEEWDRAAASLREAMTIYAGLPTGQRIAADELNVLVTILERPEAPKPRADLDGPRLVMEYDLAKEILSSARRLARARRTLTFDPTRPPWLSPFLAAAYGRRGAPVTVRTDGELFYRYVLWPFYRGKPISDAVLDTCRSSSPGAAAATVAADLAGMKVPSVLNRISKLRKRHGGPRPRR